MAVVFAGAAGVFAQAGQPSPKLISMPEPVYPEDGIALGLGGKIRVYLDVDKKGKPKVTGMAGPIAPCSDLGDERIKRLREAAAEAARKGVFEPAQKNNKPVNSFGAVTFDLPGPKLPVDEDADPPPEDGGVLKGLAHSLPAPVYPPVARMAKVWGEVQVQILINEEGEVTGAGPLTGNPLHEAAVKAACIAKFRPTLLVDKPVKVSGIITYNFRP